MIPIRYYLESFLISIRLKKQLSPEASKQYWRNPPDSGNQPEDYARVGIEKSQIVLRIIRDQLKIPKRDNVSILELGCNAGRNLVVLHFAGYWNLAGIDINPDAVARCREMGINAFCGEIGKDLPALGQFDVVFSTAVLMHISDIGDTYRQIADTVREGGYLITVENEDSDSKYFYAKNYGEIFGPFGFRQISFDKNIENGFTIRVMRKSPK